MVFGRILRQLIHRFLSVLKLARLFMNNPSDMSLRGAQRRSNRAGLYHSRRLLRFARNDGFKPFAWFTVTTQWMLA